MTTDDTGTTWYYVVPVVLCVCEKLFKTFFLKRTTKEWGMSPYLPNVVLQNLGPQRIF